MTQAKQKPETPPAYEPERDVMVTEAAALCGGLHPETLNIARRAGKGPPYIRIPGSKRIAYRTSDLKAWMEAGRVVPESSGLSMLKHRSKAGPQERAEYELASRGIEISNTEIREGAASDA
jgi:hypothetical protein